MDLTPFALQIGAVAGIIGSVLVIWRQAIRPAVRSIQSLAHTAERLAALAAPDPTDPEGKPAIVNATAQLAAQNHRAVDAVLHHDDQDWAVFKAIAKAWNEDAHHTSRLELPDREVLIIDYREATG